MATDFFTTNTDSLAGFIAAMEQKQRPVTVVSFGDSMAEAYNTASFHLMNRLVTKAGIAGYSMDNYFNTAMYSIANGAYVIEPDAMWFAHYFAIPPGATLSWNTQTNAAGIYCNSTAIFYVAHSGGGQFRFSVSTNGGPWVTKLLLDGYSPTPVGRFAKVTLQPNNYRIRLDGEVGTNYIVGPQHLSSQTGGVNVVFASYPGISLGGVTNVPLAIRQPIFAALNPDLIVWHMKEPPDGLFDRMEECERWWSNSAPNTAVIYIGTPWAYNDTFTTQTLDQNAVVRNIAVKYHRTYVDLMQPTINYSWLQTNGFLADQVHLTSVGGLYCANLMWDDLGFFSIGLNKKLSLTKAGLQLSLSYTTTNGAIYRLEASTNLQTWSGVVTNPAGNATITTNFPSPATRAYYRLGLSPH